MSSSTGAASSAAAGTPASPPDAPSLTDAVAGSSTGAAAASRFVDLAVELVEPYLFGAAKLLRGDKVYPSHSPREWLTDVHLANAHVADARPACATPVRYNYPRPLSRMQLTLQKRPAQRALHKRDSVLVQQLWRRLAGRSSPYRSKRRPMATRVATGRITFAAACLPTRQTPHS